MDRPPPDATMEERHAFLRELKRRGMSNVAEDLLFDEELAELQGKHPETPRDELVQIVRERLAKLRPGAK